MSDIAIKVENLSKAYQLGDFSTGTLSRDLERWWALMRGKEDPFLKIGEANDRAVKGISDVVWSLKDISFDIEQGDAVGVIGRNGAGKSTLLKILSRVTTPTVGSVKVKGRIASLLEVGTGFHPDLTGRENIFLNGAILGMRKTEIKKHFDAIVDFAGVERYIDTPVKRYSSGMYVRLAFAVAAHLESEILIVDEVLAVGDVEFQKKCLGKMNDVSKGEGRTVLFVSHNMGMISQLCNKGILLKNGNIISYNQTQEVVARYLADNNDSSLNTFVFPADQKKTVGQFLNFEIVNAEGAVADKISFDDSIRLNYRLQVKQYIPGIQIGIGLQDKLQNRISTFTKEINVGNGDIIEGSIKLPDSIIAPNNYNFVIAIWNKNGEVYDIHENIGSVTIVDNGTDLSLYEGKDYGAVILKAIWE
ncbi:ABC transporter ATP-binding protein [Mucilaginibacter segetis]|uniref:ABC transporter ATP-binding protein n=1 Tax=Mucilaginibacter segetis TaxID=2793071 RepID=A0A934UNC5_9SPHI|nr:ABC transporter ATP-binding protein [Mucilaginibacter segetis]MBK0380648.1 ABC transporter ATP-binding protein [Mucilaginibacter segetis]